jgi:hypothetical protein
LITKWNRIAAITLLPFLMQNQLMMMPIGTMLTKNTTADATFTDGDLTLTLRFGFTAEGLIETVRAEARGRAVGEDVIPTPWEGRWSHYAERDGMLIPLTGEVAWLLPDGPHPYWRGRVTQIRYALAPAHEEK